MPAILPRAAIQSGSCGPELRVRHKANACVQSFRCAASRYRPLMMAAAACLIPATGATVFPYSDGPQLPEDTLVRTPWHMTNVWVDFQNIPGDFEAFCTTFRVEGETPGNINFYFSPFNNRINHLQFYGGLQTRIDGVRADGRFVRRNKGAIFSRWQERDTAAIMPAGGGLSRSSGHEGDFISVRNDFDWRQGHYRLCLRKSDTVAGEPLPENYDADDIAMSWGRYEHTWVRLEATDLDSGKTTFVGALAFPGTTLALRRRNALFAEIYGSPNPFAAERVPEFRISVENFQVDGKNLSYERVTASSNTRPGNGTEPKLTLVSYENDRNRLVIGLGKFTGRFGRILTAVHPSRPAIESAGLVTAEDKRYVAALWDGREISREKLPSGRFNIRADTVDPARVASVRLELRGPVSMSRLSNDAPYLLSGGSTGLSLPDGDYRVTATPFSLPGGQGRRGEALDAEFLITSAPLPTEIEDAKLLAQIETALDTDLTEDNIASELERLERLVIAEADIASLDGLQLAGNLRVLELPGNHIENLAPLSLLSSLRELDLSGNRIEDVTPLCDLTGLRSLNLSGNRISDIGPLAALGSLERLILNGNEVSELQSVAGMSTLRRLELVDNAARNLRPVSALVDLEYLDISGNRVADLHPLSGLQRLIDLAANKNRIVRVDPLAGLLALQRLELEFNRIADLAPLGGLEALSRLHLRHNRIEDFSPLHPLIADGLQVFGMFEQLRAIMEDLPSEQEQQRY